MKSRSNFFLVKVEQNSSVEGTSIRVVPAAFRAQDNFDALINDDAPTFPFGSDCLRISSYGDRPILAHLDYFKNCSMGDTMERKSGTYDMVSATIAFCAELLGDSFTKIGVQDATSFWCGRKRVTMWLHNLLVYGETYYERKFGATPDVSDAEHWTNTKTRLGTEKASRDLVTLLMEETEKLDTPLLGLCRIMDDCVGNCTWNEMFNQLHHADCVFFSMNNLRTIQRFFKIQRVDKIPNRSYGFPQFGRTREDPRR